jgi:hypothetical protein
MDGEAGVLPRGGGMRKILPVLIVAMALAYPAYACPPAPGAKCGMQETMMVVIKHTIKADGFLEAKKVLEAENARIIELAMKQRIENFELQTQNYVIEAKQLSGTSSYAMDSADAASAFADFLTAQKIQASVALSAYNAGPCFNTPAPKE